MTSNTAIETRANDLRESLQYHSERYYAGEPEIPDADYDKILRELSDIEAQHPYLRIATSPTVTVGTPADIAFSPVEHNPRMFSLHNAFDLFELEAWYNRSVKNGAAPDVFAVEPKFDGLAVSIRYEDGKMVRAATRGDGRVGEDVTHTVKGIKDVPHQLNAAAPDVLEVRGEVYMKHSVFDSLNQQQLAVGGKAYVNPRNAAAGALRLKDGAESAKRGLSFWCYQLADVDGHDHDFTSHNETLQWLASLGLPVNEHSQTVVGLEGVNGCIEAFDNIRHELDYDCDGMVVKVDDLSKQEKLGEDSKAPRWAVAFKFPPEEQTTKLLDIEVSIGTLGQATPWGRLEPVLVGGATVSAATLHNADQVALKDVRPGDTVIVRRAGEVIPEILGPVMADRSDTSEPWQFPTNCPECSHTLSKRQGEVAIFCTNYSCPAQTKGRIEHFGSRNAMDIEHLGEKTVSVFVDEGLLHDVADIYTLDFNIVSQMEGFGSGSISNLQKAIKDSKSRPLSKLLFALSIAEVGRGNAERLANAFPSMDAIMQGTLRDFIGIEGFGDTIAQSIASWFAQPNNQNLVARLRAAGVNMEDAPSETNLDPTLQGMSIVVTGTLANYDRESVKSAIKDRGGAAPSSVSSKTTYLVVGENPGVSKVTKAEAAGVTIIDEQTFEKLLNTGQPN